MLDSSREGLHRKPQFPPSSDRSFGLVFAGFFALLALWPVVHGHPLRWWAAWVSAILLIGALLSPALLHPLNVLWAHIGRILNRITTPIFTSVLFFLLFTPVAWIRRLLGKDALRLKPSAGPSYWIVRQPPGPPPESLRHQF